MTTDAAVFRTICPWGRTDQLARIDREQHLLCREPSVTSRKHRCRCSCDERAREYIHHELYLWLCRNHGQEHSTSQPLIYQREASWHHRAIWAIWTSFERDTRLSLRALHGANDWGGYRTPQIHELRSIEGTFHRVLGRRCRIVECLLISEPTLRRQQSKPKLDRARDRMRGSSELHREWTSLCSCIIPPSCISTKEYPYQFGCSARWCFSIWGDELFREPAWWHPVRLTFQYQCF